MRKNGKIVAAICSILVIGSLTAGIYMHFHKPIPPRPENINKTINIDLRNTKLDLKVNNNSNHYINFFNEVLYKDKIQWRDFFNLDLDKYHEYIYIDNTAECFYWANSIRTIKVNVKTRNENVKFANNVSSIYFHILVNSRIEQDNTVFNIRTGVVKVPSYIDAIVDNVLGSLQQKIQNYIFDDISNSKLQILFNYTFSNLDNITTLDLKSLNRLKVVCQAPFFDLKNISFVSLPNSIEYIDSGFQNSKNLEVFNIPRNWTSLKKGMFNNCEKLWSNKIYTIPDNIKHIDEMTFGNNNFNNGIRFPKHFGEDKNFYYKIGIKKGTKIYVGNKLI